MTTSIRLAALPDRPAVETIVTAAYEGYIPRIGRKPGPMLDDYAARILARQLHVIEDDGTIRGLVVLIPEAAAMLLDNVAVDPRFKGQGFGRVLIEFAEESARAAGYTQIRLYTHVAMTENIALYGRIGYVEAYRAEENGLARVYMVKTLA